MRAPTTPMQQRLQAVRMHGFRLPALSLAATRAISVDFLSSGYLDVSVPPVRPFPPMRSAGGARAPLWRVAPFGDLRVEGCLLLTADYRSLPRPSKPSYAKASTVRPTYLHFPSRPLPRFCAGGVSSK